jgi:hypothetical protein
MNQRELTNPQVVEIERTLLDIIVDAHATIKHQETTVVVEYQRVSCCAWGTYEQQTHTTINGHLHIKPPEPNERIIISHV